ncbi:MAG: F0F1 ATP synthase subunit B [Lachnospiraceae bacterium]|nr:F0F1 ATP synthase subunit B [Lachnospiraceae bacterium]MBO4670170.1 F0F1 ATP synthase subunit B [Lachnospiraceae bacterium]MBR5667908.1 F0F1 ATP synthase subunit B [Lachnospiraceae bacterium]
MIVSSLLSAGLLYLTETAGEPVLKDKIFALDWQLIFDALIVACAVFFLFFLLSYLVFNPARDLMQKRRDKIAEDIAAAEKEKEDALAFKKEYDARLRDVDREADGILADAKRRAKDREEAIIAEAKEESARIMTRTKAEVELEKSKAKDEIKQEIVAVAGEMAGRFIKDKMDEQKQAALVDDVIREMGDATWRQE